MNLKYKILILLAALGICFFLGRKSAPQLPGEIRIEKVTNTHAIKKAVAEERKKINTKFSQKKIRDTVELPDGTVKTHEEIANTRISEETTQISKKTYLNIIAHETQKIELKHTLKRFAFELEVDAKNPVQNFSTFPEFKPELNLAGKASYRFQTNLWAFIKAEHEILNNINFIGVGVAYRLEF